MTDAISAYPLLWPAGWERTPAGGRRSARFVKKESVQRGDLRWTQNKELSIADGVQRVRAALERMGVHGDDLVINSNLELRLDGFPKSAQREPEDPGIVVYWRAGAEARCMAIDLYDRVADNLAAVAATLNAMRAIERHGGAKVLERAFTGFTALPAPADPWWEVLGVAPNARRIEIDAAYRRRRSAVHPDRGGTAADFDRVQRAYEEACRA